MTIEQIKWISDNVLGEFWILLDGIISVVDQNLTESKLETISLAEKELTWLFDDMSSKKEKTIIEKLFWKTLFVWWIKNKIDNIMNSYRAWYEELKRIAAIQDTKSKAMNIEIDKLENQLLELKLYKIESETNEAYYKYNMVLSLVQNLEKMIINLKQKMWELYAKIWNNHWLIIEMWMSIKFYESLIKDIFISAANDKVQKAMAKLMNSFRDSIEKRNDISINNWIEAAKQVAEIRINWIISHDSLQKQNKSLLHMKEVYLWLNEKVVQNQLKFKSSIPIMLSDVEWVKNIIYKINNPIQND